MILKNLIALAILSFIIISCECVTELDTDKIIIPNASTEIMFIHSMPDIGLVNIYSKVESYEVLSCANLSYSSLNYEYCKIASGTNYLKFIEESDEKKRTLYTRFVEFNKGDKITFISYGVGNKIREIILYDSLVEVNHTLSLLRFVHTSPDAPDVVFKIGNNFVSSKLPFRSFTDYTSIASSIYELNIFSAMTDSLILKLNNIKFQPIKRYTLVLRGYYGRNDDKKLDCKIIEYN
jgi:hypothetical protein